MMHDVFSILGEQLRFWRRERRLTQPALAERLAAIGRAFPSSSAT
jgi:transcriptional regulator with XRE-family HTH domain